MFDWIQQVWNSAIEWLHAVIQAIMDFLLDLAILVLDLFLQSIAAIITAIPAPDFLANGGAQQFLNGIDPGVMYFLGRAQFGPAMAILGAGFTFRLLRKIVTLGQW